MAEPASRRLSRRHALVVAAGLALAPAARRLLSSSPAWAGTTDLLTLERFAPHVGSRFTVRESRGREVTLVEAAALPAHRADRPGLSGEAFSLIFRGGGPALPDGTYTLANPAVGRVPLFLVAVGMARAGQGYQAVVDRRTPAR